MSGNGRSGHARARTALLRLRSGALRRRPDAGRRARRSVLVLALLAFVWQGFIAQAHHHPLGARTATAVTQPQIERTGTPGPSDTPATCPICHELAHSAAYLPAAPAVIDPPHAFLAWRPAALAAALGVARRPLGWRSRAPPMSIQA